ncbi:MAG: hypothetical protein DRN27_03755 [Thermoplasmata archaeon]|nr:MAG: hypothetical protein DRN27_03755 [Thermoplasmata archaeon]
MAGKINEFFREYVYVLSIITIIIGIPITIFGAIGTLETLEYTTILQDSIGISSNIVDWCPYILGLGIIILLTGIFYLYSFQKNKRFFIDELETNKRSEFVKKHQEIKNAARYLPKKYQKILQDKEKEFKIK